MKFFFLGTLFGGLSVLASRNLSHMTFPNFRCAVYFALFAWLLWNVSAWLRAKARGEDRKWVGGKVGKWERES